MNGTAIRVAIFGCCVCAAASGQQIAPTHGQQLAAMKKLAPMLGEWEGQGWIQMGPRRFNFESSEVFAPKAGGLAMVVEGVHRIPLPEGSKRVVHNAVAMITYDADKGRYRFISQLASGRGGDYEGSLTDEGDFRWVIPETPLGKMVYTISVEKDTYREVGEIEGDSGERRQFFEMNLKKSTE